MSKNPYVKTDWVDHIVDPENNEVIQEGTRFTANRANNIENGIYNLYDSQANQDAEIQKLRIQLEMVGRTPINNGTFFDTLSDQAPKNLTVQSAKAVVQSTVNAGATSLTLDSVEQFSVGQQVTVYDDAGQESVMISAVDTTNKKLTVTTLTRAYKKGAVVGRSNAVIDISAQEMKYGAWGTYSVTITEVV
ncbi:hypothetical protein EVU96_25260 [Bacillus infantis]|uniref:hypothetical protein n=1 Tax=Bacillus infantis TaxID=324767 RepID=UPI00101D3D3A|nr:hypothetical protein [Bacillus infantis]RYI24997.1 hypothetical protein EVU96_25260 [Bacillus infantis]